MADEIAKIVSDTMKKFEKEILVDWQSDQNKSSARRDDLISPGESQEQSRRFLLVLVKATEQSLNTRSESFNGVRDFLGELGRSRARQGFSPTQTATFILSLKRTLFRYLQKDRDGNPIQLVEILWQTTEMMDDLGLFVTEVYQKGRDEVISRQQQEMLELSTPVVKLWDGVLALPLIGTLDSSRTQVVMESLLDKIVSTGSEIAIIDITGVPTVDTLVAQHLMKTVAAARLMGADCIISGIRPQIAQTIVHLGVELKDITTKASLAGAFVTALDRTGYVVRRGNSRSNAQGKDPNNQ